MNSEVIELNDYFKLYRIGVFNFYVFRGEKNVLVEAGWSCVAEKLLDVLEEKLDAVILMHSHSDHITGLPAILDAFPKAEVIGHENLSNLFSKEKVINSWLEDDKEICGQWKYTEDSFRLDRAVNEGEEVYGLEFYTAIGHSPDSIIVYHRKSNTLLISDCFGFITSDGTHVPLFFYNYQQYLNSIDKILSFRPEFLGLGHMHYFRGRECDEVGIKAKEETLKAKELLKSDLPDEELYERFIAGELKFYPKKTMLGSIKILRKRAVES